ncbi:PPE family protein [Mycobacterium sp. SM1]|uniref:PPE family protein n=1 Tax=Mycobacterium sp. SM1 TaxID=2816243 RepID=UPI001BCAA411|nr:PPE family protein [Mycobacterium sp. SM1]MBS4730217.1 PPE family protein [Mycobacterium sp. SM1]
MFLDYSLLPPEINSGRIYAGPGAGSLLTAAAAWDALAEELHSAAAQYDSVISGLTAARWTGPSSTAMAAAAETYVTWLHNTAVEAEQTAGQAKAAASAYSAALAAHVPPPVIAANRSLLAALIAHNYFGQYTAAIGETERQYAQMWAQDATAMHAYARSSVAASSLAPFSPPAQNTNPAAQATQSASVAHAAGGAAGTNTQSILSQLLHLDTASGTSGASSNATNTLSTAANNAASYGSQTFGNGAAGWADAANAVSNVNNGIGLFTFMAENPAGLFETLNPPFVGPAALSFGGSGMAAGVGQAIKIGALSVPPTWALPSSAITPASFTLPISTAPATQALAGGFPGGAFGETMLGTLAGRGLGGATARALSRRRSVIPRSPVGG